MDKMEIEKHLKEIQERLKKIEEARATHALYIPQLLGDVKALKSDVASLSEDITKSKKKL